MPTYVCVCVCLCKDRSRKAVSYKVAQADISHRPVVLQLCSTSIRLGTVRQHQVLQAYTHIHIQANGPCVNGMGISAHVWEWGVYNPHVCQFLTEIDDAQ